jgi:hypothetical protein
MDMEPEELQHAWHSQDNQPVTVDVEALLSLVKRNHRNFRSTILIRDVIEIGIALALTVFFGAIGNARENWSWYVLAAGCLFVAVFMLVDRQRQRSRSPSNTETLAVWVERSRSDVEHQIWLLRNIFWWYLLPPLIGITCVYAYPIWQARHAGAGFALALGLPAGLLAGSCAFFYGVYLLNQRAVRANLLPRLKELQSLAENLSCDRDD